MAKIKESIVSLFSHSNGFKREEVQQGPAFGVDVSVIDIGAGNCLVAASDPLSVIPSIGMKASAWLSVQLMINDIATTGFAPQFAQFVLNLPTSVSGKMFEAYWQHLHHFCEQTGIAITGGHTCFAEDLNSTIAGGGTMFCIAPQKDVLISSSAKPGDVLLLTKSAALSSSALLALSFPEKIGEALGKKVLQQAQDSLYDMSVLKEAILARSVGVSAMHDVTEGGVLGAVYEMAVASGNGLHLNVDDVPIGEVQRAVCNLFNLDPLRSIGAGSMLISCKENIAQSLITILDKENTACTAIGRFTATQQYILQRKNGDTAILQYQEADPYWKAYFNALNNGWK